MNVIASALTSPSASASDLAKPAREGWGFIGHGLSARRIKMLLGVGVGSDVSTKGVCDQQQPGTSQHRVYFKISLLHDR